MPADQTFPDVVVSVQATGAEQDPARGHLSAGLLTGPDTVLVIDPDQALLDPARGFEALVIPVELAADSPIERIRVVGVDAMRPAESERLTSLVLRLAHPSEHQPTVGAFDGRRLREELVAHGDLLTALVNLGAVQAGAGTVPADLLLTVAGVEARQRQHRMRVHTYRRPGDDSFDICDYVPCCEPCPPRLRR
ncbi:hypothetical protein EV385_6247 [Krasilnikovia cinnamomea]|uniref:Uncharacterized protein n=1 Tax=Krasilnikovia cinnamomea TaxID=349313 RepID=A0A4Q7ZSW9_9ACTN|nr:hypothetical protein [Krasilnikovia cinnamomea]RZU54297.1 hypothetical protein EV385_6247 [Krasilnikovia cinnamomea]